MARVVSLSVRMTSLERRRRTLLTIFFRALERRGWKLTAESHAKFTVKMVGQTMTFGSSEVIKQKRVRSPQRIAGNTTILLMKPIDWNISRQGCSAYASTNITEATETGSRLRMATRVTIEDVIVGMLQEAARDREREEKWAEQRRQYELHERGTPKPRSVLRRQKQKIDRLIADAIVGKSANRVRAYVQHARKVGRAPVGDGRSIEEWAGWALSVADRLIDSQPGRPSPLMRLNVSARVCQVSRLFFLIV